MKTENPMGTVPVSSQGGGPAASQRRTNTTLKGRPFEARDYAPAHSGGPVQMTK